jgi:hypothetical protein
MYQKTNLEGEGARVRVFDPGSTISSFVVWPIVPPDGANMLEATQELYRLAYEWAQAMQRPSPYEFACRFVSN